MPKIDLDSIEQTNRTGYPSPFDKDVQGRWYRRLAPAGGLTDFGVSLVTLKSGAWSSQRHWHNGEDEFLVMIEGEAVLVEDEGPTVLQARRLRRLAQGQHQRPSPSERQRWRLPVHRRRRRDQHRRRLFRRRFDVHSRRPICHKDGTPY